MSLQNYTTYTETDPNSRYTVTSTKIDVAGLDRSEDAHVYKDFGAGAFSGDFEHKVTVYVNSSSQTSSVARAWMLTNAVDDVNGLRGAAENYIEAYISKASGAIATVTIAEYYSTNAIDTSINLSLDTPYYLTIVRDEAVGTYGTLYCYIYSDSGRTTLVDTLTLTLRAAIDFRYVYGANSFNNSTTGFAFTGYVENLDINRTDVFATTASLTLTANAADVDLDKNIAASTASLTLTANAATVNAALNITASTAALTLTTYAASLIPVISVDCTTAALTLTAYSADITFDKNVVATTASLTLTANVATVNAKTSISATLASLVLAAYAADVNLNKNVSATTPSLTLTAFSASITAPVGQATTLSVGNFPQGATVEYMIMDAVLGLLQDWTSTGVTEVQGPTKSAYYITTSVIGIDAGTSGVIYWRTDDLAYEASEAYDFVNIGLTLSRALAGGIAKEASVTALQSDMTTALSYMIAMSKWKNNKLARTSVVGNTETWVLYDDDSTTPLLTWTNNTTTRTRTKAT